MTAATGCKTGSDAARAHVPPPRCPVVPLKIVLTTSEGPHDVMALDSNGEITASLGVTEQHVGTLDARGCLVVHDAVSAEVTPKWELWTPHGMLRMDGSRFGPFVIAADGKVRRILDDGTIDAHWLIEISDYGADAHCAARMLLATFVDMMPMPNMTGTEGQAPIEPPPEGSFCQRFRR